MVDIPTNYSSQICWFIYASVTLCLCSKTYFSESFIFNGTKFHRDGSFGFRWRYFRSNTRCFFLFSEDELILALAQGKNISGSSKSFSL